ncbi:MAG: hypothetical protein H7A23_25470 [Leptospiraceae bacterium]|nr:hypothetical protein [Leptospiraceae bacterium]
MHIIINIGEMDLLGSRGGFWKKPLDSIFVGGGGHILTHIFLLFTTDLHRWTPIF